MTLSGGTTWEYTETFTLTASAAHFLSTDVGSEIHFNLVDTRLQPVFDPIVHSLFQTVSSDTRLLRLTIAGYTSSTVVSVQANRTIPTIFRNLPTATWGHARKIVSGLQHLENETVSILADAQVEPQQTVINGLVTLQNAACVIHVGLPIEADFETLRLNVGNNGQLIDREKNVFAVRALLEESRGLFAGPDFSADNLIEYPQRSIENYEEPVTPFTGQASIRIPSTWDSGGNVAIRQSDPLPLTILSIIPELDIGGIK
jgi:hypothetical protein